MAYDVITTKTENTWRHENMNYKNEWLRGIFSTPAASECINVKFRGDAEEQPFTMSVFDMLRTDPRVEYITSEETGEVLYCCD